MNTVPASHGIVECRHCQFCSPLNEVGHEAKGEPPYGSCRYSAPVAMPGYRLEERAVGVWPLVQLAPGNGCRLGIGVRKGHGESNPVTP